MSGPELLDLVSAGEQGQDAVAINDHIFMSRGVLCLLEARTTAYDGPRGPVSFRPLPGVSSDYSRISTRCQVGAK